MADIEPPSFSLGIDLDFEPSRPINQPQFNPDDDSQWHVSDSDPDSDPNPPPSRLRRLRRGGATQTPDSVSTPVNGEVPNFVEDDIEDFSEEEEKENVHTDNLPVSQRKTLFSGSKLPLSGCGVLKRPQESTIHNSQRRQDSSCPPSTSVASNKGKSVLQEFTSSPLRKFQLLDSDSDDPSEFADVKRKTDAIDSSKNLTQKELNSGSLNTTFFEKSHLSASTSQKQDLWKNFRVDNNGSVPTPVFDELLEEYYKGVKQNKGVSGSRELGSCGVGSSIDNVGEFTVTENVEAAGLPCHRYFFHDDNRIQRLVRSRLPYFFPISVSGDTRNMPYNASSIDYRSQFCNGNAANQRSGKTPNIEKSSNSSRKRTKKANIEQDAHASGAWIDPKHVANTPKDAGRRRVRAEGQSAGHWFTGDNGKKVYVTKTGKELTGKFAYIQYNKENGGFGKSKKKRPSKKKR
ncbi:hypothetical protein RND81_12G197300 [Saponaria officinalis]|uniref:Uncharacterized protein n=1 Tax=Saponaria officinalis TaxID=3572 RepID=A0AAW1HCZ4_SAPOF